MFRNVPECSGMFHVPDFIDGRFLPPKNETKVTKSSATNARNVSFSKRG